MVVFFKPFIVIKDMTRTTASFASFKAVVGEVLYYHCYNYDYITYVDLYEIQKTYSKFKKITEIEFNELIDNGFIKVDNIEHLLGIA